jgi:hypothetical protein
LLLVAVVVGIFMLAAVALAGLELELDFQYLLALHIQ